MVHVLLLLWVPITGQCIKAAETCGGEPFDVSDNGKNNNFFFYFFSFLLLFFLHIFFFSFFQLGPRRINYNRDPVKKVLGELFIDPACPNARARASAHIKI